VVASAQPVEFTLHMNSKPMTPTQRDNETLKAAGWTWSNGRYVRAGLSLNWVNRRVALVLTRTCN